MYAEPGLFYPYLQNTSQDFLLLEDYYYRSQKPNAPMNNLVETSSLFDYDFGGAGDLFKAPEPIIEEPVLGVDPITASISMISCGEDIITTQGLKAEDFRSIQSDEQLLNDVFYECQKDIIAQEAAIESSPFSQVWDIKIPVAETNQNHQIQENTDILLPVQKSVSSGNLSSMEWVQGVGPNFLDFTGMDFGFIGMRRAFSEGDIKTLDNGPINLIHSSFEPLRMGNCISEARKEKLSRYRHKKSKRNFGRKIKYACRKALADNQPRIRGRFAKTEYSVTSVNRPNQ